jgi:hypothetical protein
MDEMLVGFSFCNYKDLSTLIGIFEMPNNLVRGTVSKFFIASIYWSSC